MFAKIKKYLLEYRLGKVGIFDLPQLSYDIKNLKTNEALSQNDFYGNATVLKKYCNISNTKTIKASIEHGFFWNNFVWDCDINHNFPSVIIQGEIRKSIIAKKNRQKDLCNRHFYSICRLILFTTRIE